MISFAIIAGKARTENHGAGQRVLTQRLDIPDQIVDFGAGQRLYPAVRMRQDDAELVLAHTALGDRAKARVTTGAPLLRNLVAFLGIGMRSAARKQRRYCHKCDQVMPHFGFFCALSD
jgi:hypothetical protein